MLCSVLLKYSELCLAGISQKSQPPPPPPKKSIGARPHGFKNPYPSKKPATVTQQLTKSIDFCQNYVCDCHLWRGAECHCPVAALLVREFSSKLEFFANFLYICVISLTGRRNLLP
jgi:hypothetical protein